MGGSPANGREGASRDKETFKGPLFFGVNLKHYGFVSVGSGSYVGEKVDKRYLVISQIQKRNTAEGKLAVLVPTLRV